MSAFLAAAKRFRPVKTRRVRPPKTVKPRTAAHVAWLKRNGMWKAV